MGWVEVAIVRRVGAEGVISRIIYCDLFALDSNNALALEDWKPHAKDRADLGVNVQRKSVGVLEASKAASPAIDANVSAARMYRDQSAADTAGKPSCLWMIDVSSSLKMTCCTVVSREKKECVA